MSFLESPRFPTAIAYGAVGGPTYDTSVGRLPHSAVEARNINRQDGLGKWEVAQSIKTQAELDVLVAFFRVAKGMGNAFRFKDHADFSATSAQGHLVNLTTTTWQMVKRYTSGSATEDRLIQKPVSGTVTVSGGGSYSVDYTTGIITKSGGADPTAWAGQFDVPCRFDTDEMKVSIVDLNAYTWGQIMVIEIPL